MAIGTEEAGKDAGLTPRARIVRPPSRAPSPRSCSPARRPAARKALAEPASTIDDIDLFEINEAGAGRGGGGG